MSVANGWPFENIYTETQGYHIQLDSSFKLFDFHFTIQYCQTLYRFYVPLLS